MKKLIVLLSIGFFCVLMLNNYFESTEAALAQAVIRFHVVANSNSKGDQDLKLKVRNRVINEMNSVFSDSGDIISARECIARNMEKIEEIAKDEIRKNNYSYDVKVSLGTSTFPTKEYGEVVLPAGNYEALKIEIGKAGGENWWCVLFPPLCFVDKECVSYTEEKADIVAGAVGGKKGELVRKDKSPVVKIKFKSYEAWQNSKQRIAYMLGFKTN